MPTNYPLFRVRLDVPYSFAVEPGFVRSTHCHNFREGEGQMGPGTWRDANTGLVMMEPSFLNQRWYLDLNWQALAAWETDPDFWRQVYRGINWKTPAGADQTAARLFSLMEPPPGNAKYDYVTHNVAQSLVPVAIDVINFPAAFLADILKWTLKAISPSPPTRDSSSITISSATT